MVHCPVRREPFTGGGEFDFRNIRQNQCDRRFRFFPIQTLAFRTIASVPGRLRDHSALHAISQIVGRPPRSAANALVGSSGSPAPAAIHVKIVC